MEINKISSKDNENIKFLKKLKQKKHRDKNCKFFIENLVIIYDALKSGFKFESLFLTKNLVELGNEKIKYILDNTNKYFLIDENVNSFFSDLDTPSGVCAIYNKNDIHIHTSKRILYLNAISDPGNLGTILRTALAFGFYDIVVDEKCADLYNTKTISAARDSIFKLRIEKDNNQSIFKKIKSKMKIYASNVQKGSSVRMIENVDKFCLVFGNESNGVSKEILEQADAFIKIKMSRGIESINVSVAAGIILHEVENMLKLR